MIGKRIAEKIKQLRMDKGLTLAELGRNAGVSKALLSRIENHQSSPPIATLEKIAQGLGMPISYFFIEAEPGVQRLQVIRKAERRHTERRGSKIGLNYINLSDLKPPYKIEAYIMDLPANSRQPRILFDHQGEEFMLVLEGEVELTYDQEKIRLEAGDSVHFDASGLHRAKACGRE